MQASDFGSDFCWGVSSSSYQTEGAFLTDGKGPSIWDEFCKQHGKIQDGKSATIACDFYNHYIQDLILMQFLNIPNFRFSISWPRLFPNGIGGKNEKGFDYYDRLIDYCLELGIQPWITLYHWDLPAALEHKGGWMNREIIHWFEEYVTACIKRYSDRVAKWMVLNEPLAFTGAGYFLGLHAPGKKGLSNFIPAMHHAALCQGIGASLIKSFNSSLQVGTTFSCAHIDPISNTALNMEAARRMDALLNKLYIHPLLGLGYPVNDLPFLKLVEKYFQPNDLHLMEAEMDFIGLQNYTREVVSYSPFVPYLNARLIKAKNRHVPMTEMEWEIYPRGIYELIKMFDQYPRIKSLIITENGAAFDDKVVDDKINDLPRINYLQAYLSEVLKAKSEGAKVDGYFAWSFTDNFEWSEGYSKRFGLVYVDYQSQKRIIKSSGYWYRNFLAQLSSKMHRAAV